MSFLKKFLTVGILTIFVNFACASESRTNEEVLSLIYENVVLKDIQKAIDDLNSVEKSLEKKIEKVVMKISQNLFPLGKVLKLFIY